MGALLTAEGLSAIGNHLWQSTLFAAAVAVLALAFRRHHARVRYGLWLAASIKFLIPFAALTAIGGAISWRTVDVVPFAAPGLLLETMSEPFSQTAVTIAAPGQAAVGTSWVTLLPAALVIVWALGGLAVCAAWLGRWRRVHATLRRGVPLEQGREVESVQRLAPRHRVRPIPIVVSDSSLEPGVFGILRPVLLWPRGIGDHLSDEQITAVLAHELCHLRRRDNLAAALHMVVQALCWFHPLVWWIGARLVDERERACDEEVLRLGSEPEVYAESILKTCQFFLESPLACVAGITGSDLRGRIEHIMADGAAAPLGAVRRLLLASTATLAIVAPIAIGVLNGRPLAAQVPAPEQTASAFEVTSVKPNDGTVMRVTQRFVPGGGFEAFNVTVGAIIRLAYRLQDFQMAGEPEWIHIERFDIQARGPEGAQQSEISQRIQALLADRFKLEAHRETRDLPIYALTLAHLDGTLGPQLTRSSVDCQALAAARGSAAPVLSTPGERPQCGWTRRPGGFLAGGTTITQLASTLGQFTGRIVVDRTGLTGPFDLDLDFTPEPPARPGIGLGGGLPVPPGANNTLSDPQGVTIFTAVEEQLGLKLVSETGPVEVLVIDHIERPEPD